MAESASTARRPSESRAARPPPRASSAVPSGSGGSGSQEPPEAAAAGGGEAAASVGPTREEADEVKRRVEAQEAEVRAALSSKLTDMRKRAALLASLQRELASLEAPSQSDVEIIRQRITACDLEVLQARTDVSRLADELQEVCAPPAAPAPAPGSRAAGAQANARLERKQQEKAMLTEHLRLILYESEKKKQERLLELQARLRDAGE